MIIYNVRLGFANNSSSSHSFIFMPTGHKTKDFGCRDGEYGWDFFTSASQKNKQQYFGILLRNKLEQLLAQERKNPETFSEEYEFCKTTANRMASEFIGAPLNHECYIDHQSIYDLPLTWDEKNIHEEFAREFQAWVLKENLVIVGGNDNTDEVHPLSEKHKKFRLPIPQDGSYNIIARHDTKKNFWTLFNRNSGAKVRMNFDHALDHKKHIYKASTPELVDLKITDFCPFKCKFCYQGSTVYGKHADFDQITEIIKALAEMQVFEIALGGGEPTMHPQFIEILKLCREHYIVPNFTTYNLQWLKQRDFAMAVFKYCGSFAVSVQNAEKVGELLTALAGLPVTVNGYSRDENKVNVAVQTIIGVVTENDLQEIIRAIASTRIDLTLLGYKTTHRGADFEQRQDFDWVKVIKENSGSHARIAIDTLLAQQALVRLRAEKVPEWMYHLEEGKFSMYIDAVAMQAGPSSYCESSGYVNITQQGLLTSISEAFASF